MFYVLHGTLKEKEFEIYVYIGAILFILSYCVLEYILNNEGQTKVKLVSNDIQWKPVNNRYNT